MLRLGVGPVGAGWIGWGLVVAASFVLLAGHGPRLAWAARWWTVALGAAFVAFAGSAGWLGAGGGATLVLLAPVACGLSAAVGTGVVAFEQDLAQRRFGWRQSAGVVALAVFAAGLLPVLVSSAGGRSLLPVAGYEQVASFTPASQGSYKVLWLGDPVALPGPGWQLERGLAYSVSSGPLPDGTRLWPSPNPGTGSEVAVALKGATDGVTVRLGAALASAGIRYVVVPESVGPVLPGEQTPPRAPVPPGLVTALVSESDMRELPTEGGVLVFESTASRPVIAGASTKAGTGVRAAWRELGVATGLFVTALCIAEGVVRRRSRRKLAS